MQNGSKNDAHGSTKGIIQSLTRADPENSETREGGELAIYEMISYDNTRLLNVMLFTFHVPLETIVNKEAIFIRVGLKQTYITNFHFCLGMLGISTY